MPIEVKELIIRTIIDDSSKNEGGPSPHPIDEEKVIERCVKQVLKVLDKREEP